jgi:diguanylate cyclase (GGDEF)-like protein/PAS domain S-box-containing protein
MDTPVESDPQINQATHLLLQQVFERMSDGVSVFDDTGRIVICNPAMGMLVGRPIEDLLGKTAAEAWGTAEILPRDVSSYTAFEEAFTRPDGHVCYVSVRTFGVSKDPPLRAALYRNVTRLKQNQRTLFESEQSYRQVIENIGDGIAIVRNSKFTFVSRQFAELLGYNTDDLVDQPEHLIYSPRTLLNEREEAASSKLIQTFMRRRDGTDIPVDIARSAVQYRGESGTLITMRDASQRMRAEVHSDALAIMAKRLGSAKSALEVAHIGLEVAMRLLKWDAAYFDVLASDIEQKLLPGHKLIPLLTFDTIDGIVTEVEMRPDATLPEDSPSFRAVQNGAFLVNRTVQELGESLAFGDIDRLSKSLIYVPIIATAGPAAVISVQSYTANAYTEADLDMLQQLAENCSGALERTRTEQNMRLLESAVRHAHDMVVITAATPGSENPSAVVYVNEAFERVTGYSKEEILGKSIKILQGEESDPTILSQLRDSLLNDRPATVELVNYKKDGSPYEIEFSAFPISDQDGKFRYYVSVQRDITDRKREHRQLTHRAFHDALTNLPNRALFMERLNRAMARFDRYEEYFAVLYLDLDKFKEINDRYGHPVGDEVLMGAARRLEGCVRPTDSVGRFGGDEFTILLEAVSGSPRSTVVADRILQVMSVPFTTAAGPILSSASIGIAHIRPEYKTAEEVLRHADEALYQAKSLGKNRVVIFGA